MGSVIILGNFSKYQNLLASFPKDGPIQYLDQKLSHKTTTAVIFFLNICYCVVCNFIQNTFVLFFYVFCFNINMNFKILMFLFCLLFGPLFTILIEGVDFPKLWKNMKYTYSESHLLSSLKMLTNSILLLHSYNHHWKCHTNYIIIY